MHRSVVRFVQTHGRAPRVSSSNALTYSAPSARGSIVMRLRLDARLLGACAGPLSTAAVGLFVPLSRSHPRASDGRRVWLRLRLHRNIRLDAATFAAWHARAELGAAIFIARTMLGARAAVQRFAYASHNDTLLVFDGTLAERRRRLVIGIAARRWATARSATQRDALSARIVSWVPVSHAAIVRLTIRSPLSRIEPDLNLALGLRLLRGALALRMQCESNLSAPSLRVRLALAATHGSVRLASAMTVSLRSMKQPPRAALGVRLERRFAFVSLGIAARYDALRALPWQWRIDLST